MKRLRLSRWQRTSARFRRSSLGLAIGPARADGFHELTTMYQTLAVHDVVSISASRASETSVSLSSNHPWVPPDGAQYSVAHRRAPASSASLSRLRSRFASRRTCRSRGGMGAGSANAAAALLGLERELGLCTARAGAAAAGSGDRIRCAAVSDRRSRARGRPGRARLFRCRTCPRPHALLRCRRWAYRRRRRSGIGTRCTLGIGTRCTPGDWDALHAGDWDALHAGEGTARHAAERGRSAREIGRSRAGVDEIHSSR